jgi:hypothetical protein
MRSDKKTNPQTATSLTLNKLSVVKKPAHEGAVAKIIKSATDHKFEVRKQEFAEAIQEIQIEEALRTIIDQTWDMNHALRKSIKNTMKDETITNKKEVIQRSISDFATALRGIIASSNVIKTDGGTEMKKEEIAEMIKEAVTPIQEKLDEANAVIKTYKDKDKEVEKEVIKTEDDETLTSGGVTIKKSVVGEDMFAFMKKQQEDLDAERKVSKAAREKAELQDFTKQAELRFPNLPGTPSDKGSVMKAISKMSKEDNDAVTAMLKAGNEAINLSGAFEEIGHSYTKTGAETPVAKLNKMAETYATENSVDFAKAYDAVLATNEGIALYEESLKK